MPLPCKVGLLSNGAISPSPSMSKSLASFDSGPGVMGYGDNGLPASLNYLPSFNSASLSLKKVPGSSMVITSKHLRELVLSSVSVYRNISTPHLTVPGKRCSSQSRILVNGS